MIAFFSYDSILSYTFEDGNVFTLKASVKLEDDTMESIENEETYHFVTEQVIEFANEIHVLKVH